MKKNKKQQIPEDEMASQQDAAVVEEQAPVDEVDAGADGKDKKKASKEKDSTKKQKASREQKKLLKKVTKAVDKRLSGRRLKHVRSVADTAVKLARMYGVDEQDARIAGLLHDWDKLLTDAELPARLEELGIEPPENIDYLYPVLHSFTGAKAVQREFPELSDEIIRSIHNHTLGSKDMSDLDIVIFIADMIEPHRQTKGRPQIKELRKLVGKVPLDELYFAGYAVTIQSLLDRRRFIDPMAVDIWNDLVQKHHPIDITRQGDPNVVL